MKGKTPKDLPASVRQRLLNLAQARKEDFQYLLTRYGMERFLYRLSQSEHVGNFILKGAMLFQLWHKAPHRPTRDLDLLAKGVASVAQYETILREIFNIEVAPDGLTFDAASIQGEPIKEDDNDQGIRMRGLIRLRNVRIRLQVDIGFGDAVTPGPLRVQYPTLLEFPAPTLLAYNRETVVAEKFQAMVLLGIANSRMKDFFDIWSLAKDYEFEGSALARAIEATFARRETQLPGAVPLALSDEFAADQGKQMQWKAFIRKGELGKGGVALTSVVELMRSFLMPVIEALRGGRKMPARWHSGGPWQSG
jgi:predicted nucleotidyltransferase component of viral defense system